MYIQTSDDIVNIAISIAVIVVALALVWLLVELVRIIRPLRRAVEAAAERIERIDATLAAALSFVRSIFPGGSKNRTRRRSL